MTESDNSMPDNSVPDESATPEPAEPEAQPVGEDPVDDDSQQPDLERQLEERTLDLQRLQAEYVNYKRRVDRDRELVRGQGETAVLQSLLTVLDDIGRAAEHGQLEGGFKAVADSLQGAVAKHKLESFGAKGDPFDPSLHEAVFHAGESAEVDVTSIDTVMRTGYRVGERVLRAATVGVVDPVTEVAAEPEAETETEAPTGTDDDS